MKEKYFDLLPITLLSIALIICTIIIATTWRGNRRSDQTITVTGSAKKEIVSDLGFLRGTISARAVTAEAAYNGLISQKPIVVNYLKSKGFPEEKIEFYPVTNSPVFEIGIEGRPTNKIIAYVYNQRIEISSNDVEKIKAVSLDISSVVKQGVDFMVEMPEYHYTKLADLKIEIQAEAAKDAMNRAGKIAASTGRTLGPLRTARMGILQITPKFSNMISDYGVNDVSSIDKEITAVVNASFEIE
ncbi:MAG: SIMPL domain-containing protein [Bacillota bacterium]